MADIDLGEYDERFAGKVITVKERLSFGDSNAIKRASRRVGPGGELVGDPENADVMSLRVTIQAWPEVTELGLPGGTVTEEHIEGLDWQFAEWLMQRLSEHYEPQRRTDSEAKESGGNSTSRSTTNARASRRS